MPIDYLKPPTPVELEEFARRMRAATPEKFEGGYRWRIKCPHCELPMTVVVPVGLLDTLAVVEPRAVCQCNEDHPKRPKDATLGCGFEAMIEIKMDGA